ncbi:hypothetical protein ANO11243_067700 [Dothideomycetidae sp. 11243]|nr:hypothetical protein ANO11243_067700 [fungal sp. No.11243]
MERIGSIIRRFDDRRPQVSHHHDRFLRLIAEVYVGYGAHEQFSLVSLQRHQEMAIESTMVNTKFEENTCWWQCRMEPFGKHDQVHPSAY